jgi:hypothetical protein
MQPLNDLQRIHKAAFAGRIRCFATVFRDSLVRREILRIDSFSRNAIRRTMFKSPIWIAPLLPPHAAQGKGAIGSALNEIIPKPDHLWVKINNQVVYHTQDRHRVRHAETVVCYHYPITHRLDFRCQIPIPGNGANHWRQQLADARKKLEKRCRDGDKAGPSRAVLDRLPISFRSPGGVTRQSCWPQTSAVSMVKFRHGKRA